MQFGVGILGKGWTIEGEMARLLVSDTPAGPNFHLHAAKYAGKIAGETINAESPIYPDLTDEGIVRQCAGCARPVRMSEAPMVREAFIAQYWADLEIAA